MQTIAEWTGGKLVQGDPAALVDVVSTDTRTLRGNALFVALSGERYDAHDFLAAAAGAGAAALLVSKERPYPPDVAVIRAADSLAALQQLARAWRRSWNGIVTGLTGSNGKTSTKDLTCSVLARRWNVNATAGNLNNHIGLPLTILATGPEHQMAVCEMGMNHPGEIALLAEIAAPDAGIITNVGTAHIEFMGTREAIAAEKGMLAEAVPESGCVVLNANDDFTPAIRDRCRAGVLTAGIGAGDVCIDRLTAGADGCRFMLHFPDGTRTAVHLRIPGRHMAGNAALAAAAGFHFGMRAEEIAAGLESAMLTHGRLEVRRAGNFTIIDDSYNANPDSVRAALDTLLTFPCRGRRIAVLGRMAELGEYAARAHREAGAAVRESGAVLCAVGGEEAQWMAGGFDTAGGHHAEVFPDTAACATWLRSWAAEDDLILIKGSRSAGMERIVDALLN